MAIRANHYDAAFEEFLRQARVPYVAVNEARRAWRDDRSLKSLDFLICSPTHGRLLVDVKGRRGPHPGETSARLWENWATADDLSSMEHWESVFGEGCRALLVFAYWLAPQTAPESAPAELPVMLTFRERHYSFFGVWAADYRRAMKTRSPSWDTVWLTSAWFRDLRFSLAPLARPTAATAS